MDNGTILQLTYGELKELMNNMQDDGFKSDGCPYSLHLDADEEIEYEIKMGYIKVMEE